MNGSPGYELRFHSPHGDGRSYVFPCDAQGHVDMDSLDEKARTMYLYARAVMEREPARPQAQSHTPCAVGPPLPGGRQGDSPCFQSKADLQR